MIHKLAAIAGKSMRNSFKPQKKSYSRYHGDGDF